MLELTEGQVVEFLDSRRFFCAVCLGKKNNRFHLLTHQGKELNLSAARIIHLSHQHIQIQPRDKALETLKDIDSTRRSLQSQVVIPELWELLREEGDVWEVSDIAGLVFGKEAEADHEAAIIRAVITESVHFKFKANTIVVQNEEKIKKALEQKAKEKAQLEKIKKGQAFLQQIWAEGAEREKVHLDDPGISFLIEAIKNFCLKGTESEDYLLVKNLFKDAGLNLSSASFETLVKAGVWDEDINLDLLRHDMKPEFSKLQLDEGKRLASITLDRKHRIDLTALDLFTIDAAETSDLDDAISFKQDGNNIEIGIHITDIALKIGPESPLFKEAIDRATSIYLPDIKIPMLPESLSQDVWSLVQGKPREALSFFALVGEEGIIKHTRIIPSIIKVKERLTYHKVTRDIQDGKQFKPLYDICNQIQNQRIKNGALPLPIPELAIDIDGNGEIRPRLLQMDASRFMVAECMILANHIAANFLQENRIPAMYRSQQEPRERIVAGIDTDIKINYQQRRLISRGELGPKPERHSGLGLNAYTTITSPMRRGLDLLMQQQIASFIHEKRYMHTMDRLSKYKILLQEGLKKAGAVRQSRMRYWLLTFFQKHIDVPMDAWILDANQKIIAVLSNYLVPVELPKRPDAHFNFGQDVQVCIKKSIPRENVLKVDWL